MHAEHAEPAKLHKAQYRRHGMSDTSGAAIARLQVHVPSTVHMPPDPF